MLQFFAQSPKGTFDAIISDAEYVQKLTAQKALDPLKSDRLSQPRRLPPEVSRLPAAARAGRQDLGQSPTRFSFYGLSYNTKYMSEDEAKTWNSLFRPSSRARSRCSTGTCPT